MLLRWRGRVREIGYTFDKFTKGLRLFEGMPKNSDTLVECFNVVPRLEGLVERSSITTEVTGVTANHPWPQVFLGAKHWVCCTESKIYTVNSDWTVTQQLDLSVYYNTFPSAPKGTWHFADFFDYVVLTNGGVTVVYNPEESRWEYNDGVKIPTLGSVLNFNGQIIGTGRDTVTGDPKTIFGETTSNFLLWGGIGEATFILDQSNVKGYRPLPWFGEIYKVLQLDQYIVAYGSSGIAIVKFEGVTLGIVRTFNFGILSREAVDGETDKHVLIDSGGYLRELTADLKMSQGMYKEFFSTMSGREVVVTKDRLLGEFYITDGVRGFVKSDQGLGEVGVGPTTLTRWAGVLRGLYTDFSNSYVYMTSESLDFGLVGKKTLDSLQVGLSASVEVQGSIGVKNNYTGSFSYSGWKTLNPNGYVVFPVNGSEFKVRLRASSYVGFKVDYITVNVKLDDKRFRRGLVNADKVTSRSGSQLLG